MSDTALIKQVPEDFPYETVTQVGAGMMVTGVIGFFIGWARGDRREAARRFDRGGHPGTRRRRRHHASPAPGKNEGAEDRVLAELDALHPVARAQVLKTVADEQLKDFKGE